MRTLREIKLDIERRIALTAQSPLSLLESLEIIKLAIEDVIRSGGAVAKTSLITSQQIVNLLHETVKSAFILEGVNSTLIKPNIGRANPEITLAGFLKFKKQDVCIFPNNLNPRLESLDFNGLYSTGVIEPYGELFTEHILSVNVRTQLSSLGNNVDTMFERTYAEPLNLHRRVPKMVLGEMYLISVKELNSSQIAQNNPIYNNFTPATARQLEKYIKGFSALNLRKGQRDDDFKYERVALIIADFSQNPIKIYSSTQQLIQDNLLPANSSASIDNLQFDGFARTLLDIYEQRFGLNILT
ncbi:hypothetical protein [Cognataquiflexum aquatile]|uniref:hypothetical protein n=1 Tax=Cognataquiflexum aquatile TaxID=2249427 RepID=UPI001300B1BA|nr:hypothetical protein [Cognataquiflexum aquatile]